MEQTDNIQRCDICSDKISSNNNVEAMVLQAVQAVQVSVPVECETLLLVLPLPTPPLLLYDLRLLNGIHHLAIFSILFSGSVMVMLMLCTVLPT